MRKSVIFGAFGIASMLMVSGYGHEVVAQGAGLTTGGSSSNYGSVSLASGFLPDPHRRAITTGGNLNVSTMNLGAGCVGYVTRRPDYILRLTSASSMLKFKVQIPGARTSTRTDATLVINGADGSWRCNDDTNGANPQVNIANAGAGQYDIWVGSYVSGANARGTLIITER